MRHALRHIPLLLDLSRREFRLRYLGSILGSYWNIAHPLVMIFIYTVIFSQVMHARLAQASSGQFSYSIYLCSGLLAWNFFSEIVTRGNATLLENASFLKKIAFPPYVLFGASYVSAAINFAISFSFFAVLLLAVKSVAILNFVAFLVIVAMFALFGLGLATALGCLNVFLRDVQQLTAIIFQLWFWFTPVVYLEDSLPPFARTALAFNPAYPFIHSMHELLFFDRLPLAKHWALMAVWLSLSLCFGAFVYRRSISLVRDQL